MAKKDFEDYMGRKLTAEEYVTREMNRYKCSYGGELEDMKEQLRHLTYLIPKLVGKLYEDGQLTKEDVMELI